MAYSTTSVSVGNPVREWVGPLLSKSSQKWVGSTKTRIFLHPKVSPVERVTSERIVGEEYVLTGIDDPAQRSH